ncbi:hypothetical protein H704_01043 [Bartonella bacilliformis Peru38]|uniref:Flagellar protein FliL n=2 Tax=Bartonella bacilliformis TaxID=774 RepID=A1UTW1_BARBK|nr:hypothetical protein [Bartonella bacilliformis]ABM45637.1 conserved hypothetical protein [Bartonella bacilliformis KC583]AMG86158.1 hypothetical protein AL467_05465 [Bartonella bacilliformis]EKS43052.1 hypothetical protein BbINS_05437 [Bartonella bacilliformis INS]EYS88608.1 hypothetical protein X472_01159 [Bartonella bacilliformis San Pedro600-02]KEG19804.1 hypothetical protein H704_01043 [Bartonella bacilliformis Peru38]
MIKMIALGLWVCLVSLGALMLGINSYKRDPNIPTTPVSTGEEIGSSDTEIMNIPILVDGSVQGYLIAQLTYVVDKKAAQNIVVPVSVLIHDAIFQNFWGSYSNVRMIERVKFDMVKQQIMDQVNQRFSNPILKDLLVKQFNYISVEKIRGATRRSG